MFLCVDTKGIFNVEHATVPGRGHARGLLAVLGQPAKAAQRRGGPEEGWVVGAIDREGVYLDQTVQLDANEDEALPPEVLEERFSSLKGPIVGTRNALHRE